ncbi:FUSC family protein [Spongiactinospora sp. TRM90649]|uniref:FUSC family protein n=1 Tax=Spongiactinospora sp. TRM90649 TaxID=3031114 RepID=UPI0023F858DA|nr:FUSC family protein [Spongiactinospora sp. TRM90649]MDF5754878.1 FUSC family protein [Spongiactinospora sp. TRM90649]
MRGVSGALRRARRAVREPVRRVADLARRAWEALPASLREAYEVPGRPAWGYGALCGTAICVLLLAGALTGHVREGSTAALGAYLTSFADDPAMPYGRRARRLLRNNLFIMIGTGVGSLVEPNPWIAVPVVALIAAAGAYWNVIGLPPTLATILSYFQGPLPEGVLLHVELAGIGGLWITGIVLLTWPLRRLRPLRSAFESAGLALADLLDSAELMADSEQTDDAERAEEADREWEARRKDAEDALAEARVAVAHYIAVEREEEDEDDPTPGRMLDALTRIFHEVVAMRILRDGVTGLTERRDWVEDLDEAAHAQAEALRDAMCRDSPRGVPKALACAARFADRVEAIRRSTLSGDEPLAVGALLGQIRRCVDRIGVATRSAALISAEGVAVGPRLPRFTAPPGTRHKGPHTAHFALRLAVVTVCSMVLMLVLHEEFGKWFVVTVVANLRPTFGDTVERVLFPVMGTAIGATAGAFMLALTPGHVTLALVIGALAVVGYALRTLSHNWWTLFGTPLSLLLADYVIPLSWNAAVLRVLFTVAGAAVVFVAARWLWPRAERYRVSDRLADMLEEHARLVRALADQKRRDVAARVEEAAESAQRLDESLERLGKEPGGTVPEPLRDAVDHAARVRDDALALYAVPAPDPGADESAPTSAVLDAVADRLEATADAVRTGDHGGLPDDLDEALDALATHVEDLTEQRLDEVAEGAAEEWTAIRYAYTHAASAHPTLEDLVTNASRLSKAAMSKEAAIV